MKFLTVLTAILAVACGYPAVSTWTLHELAEAVQDPATDPALLPYLESALNGLMDGLMAGQQQSVVIISVPVQQTLTLEELSEAVNDPSTNPALLPYYENALHNLMVAMINGQEEASITVVIPAMQVNMWTLEQLSEALQNPETDPELSIFLEHALNQMMQSLAVGKPLESIAVVTPPGVIATAPALPQPELTPPVEIVPAPVETNPTPVESPEPEIVSPELVGVVETPVTVSPLVQIIINVNQQ